MQIAGDLTEPLVQIFSCVSEVVTMMMKLGYITFKIFFHTSFPY